MNGKATPPEGMFPEPYSCSFRFIKFCIPRYFIYQRHPYINHNHEINKFQIRKIDSQSKPTILGNVFYSKIYLKSSLCITYYSLCKVIFEMLPTLVI